MVCVLCAGWVWLMGLAVVGVEGWSIDTALWVRESRAEDCEVYIFLVSFPPPPTGYASDSCRRLCFNPPPPIRRGYTVSIHYFKGGKEKKS